MKAIKRLLLLIIIGALIGGTVYGVKTLGKTAPDGSKGPLAQVQNVVFNPATLTFTWDAVENAKQYEVEFCIPNEAGDGIDNYCTRPTTKTSEKIEIKNADKRLKGITMTYRVRALKTRDGYSNGEWSIEQSYNFPPAA